MAELQRLRAEHAGPLLEFELANRAYFSASISDRGDDFFEHFADRHAALLKEQESGVCAFYALVDDDGSILGRFNLVDIDDGTAELGYRVAERVAGRGVATSAVRDICRLALLDHGVRTLKARTTYGNVGSRRVLAKVGFVESGPADIVGQQGIAYEYELGQSPPR